MPRTRRVLPGGNRSTAATTTQTSWGPFSGAVRVQREFILPLPTDEVFVHGAKEASLYFEDVAGDTGLAERLGQTSASVLRLFTCWAHPGKKLCCFIGAGELAQEGRSGATKRFARRDLSSGPGHDRGSSRWSEKPQNASLTADEGRRSGRWTPTLGVLWIEPNAGPTDKRSSRFARQVAPTGSGSSCSSRNLSRSRARATGSATAGAKTRWREVLNTDSTVLYGRQRTSAPRGAVEARADPWERQRWSDEVNPPAACGDFGWCRDR